MPFITRDSDVPFYKQIYVQIARDIEEGAYPPGKKLPSIRQSAKQLGVSNTTIELAYQRLCEEGYAEARRGSGYVVIKPTLRQTPKHAKFSSEYRQDLKRLQEFDRELRRTHSSRYDFSYDATDPSNFPYAAWARATRDVLFGSDSLDACLYNDRQGLWKLREEITRNLATEYDVHVLPEQIIVGPTTRDITMSILELFEQDSLSVSVEEPGYSEVRAVLEASDAEVKSLHVYPMPTWESLERELQGTNVVFLTPANQFPTNATMPMGMRERYIEWATRTDAYIIDDEYRYGYQQGETRMPPIAALDFTGHTIMLASFSDSFTPAICISYAVLPPKVAIKWLEKEGTMHPRVPWQTQRALADFMKQGLWAAHVRKARTTSRTKFDMITAAIDKYLGGNVELLNSHSSLYLLMQTKDGRSERALVEAAKRANIAIYPTSQYWYDGAPAGWRYVLVGYSRIPRAQIDEGIKELARAWGMLR